MVFFKTSPAREPSFHFLNDSLIHQLNKEETRNGEDGFTFCFGIRKGKQMFQDEHRFNSHCSPSRYPQAWEHTIVPRRNNFLSQWGLLFRVRYKLNTASISTATLIINHAHSSDTCKAGWIPSGFNGWDYTSTSSQLCYPSQSAVISAWHEPSSSSSTTKTTHKLILTIEQFKVGFVKTHFNSSHSLNC